MGLRHFGTLAFFCMVFGVMPEVSCTSSVKHTRMKPFRWLEGRWESQRTSGIMEESWRTVDDSSMAGRSVLQKPDGSSQLFEHIELVYRDNVYHYVVTSPAENGGDQVFFRLSSFTDSGFTAENPQHDFPKRIMYRYLRPDSIQATIDSGPGQAGERVEFPFRKKIQ